MIYSPHEEIGLFDDVVQIQKEESLQSTMLGIKRKFGKNSLLKGTNLQEGATMIERNQQFCLDIRFLIILINYKFL